MSVAAVQPHVKRRGRPVSEAQVWADLADDVFALLDEAGDDLRRLHCFDVATVLRTSAPEVLHDALTRVVQTWSES